MNLLRDRSLHHTLVRSSNTCHGWFAPMYNVPDYRFVIANNMDLSLTGDLLLVPMRFETDCNYAS